MVSGDTRVLFSQPELDDKIRNSWERFLQGGSVAPESLRYVVEDSWKRCSDLNVDPGIYRAPSPISDSNVSDLRYQHRVLIDACKPVMLMASGFLQETGTVMVLTDRRGTVLDVEGDTSTLGPAENIHLLPGASWNENVCGTNAIGTALALGHPVQIHSQEHYCEGIKHWTCSAAVIRDPLLGEILGVVDVSGLSRSYSRHSLSLVVTTANRVETYLTKLEMQFRVRLIERSISPFMAADGSAVVLLDRHGFPIKLNERAPDCLRGLGVDLDLSKATRISGFANAGPASIADEKALPVWLRPEWVEPVIDQGERVGSIMRIPLRDRRTHVGMAPGGRLLDFTQSSIPGAIGSSPEFRQVVARAGQLAKSRVPVLLLGETGVGKEVFAQGMHRSSKVSDGPFVALNCGAFSRDLLASELFGHVEGAFTGARRGGVAGKIEAADGGTLFLDELGEMPLELQSHFLRVLEDGKICRLGDNNPRQVRFRLIAATNRDLRQEVAEGRFRMDLFYRISVTSVRIPPLRERASDIAELARSFLRELSTFHEIPEKLIGPDALAALERYSWPGNVRELRNVVEGMILTAPDEIIGVGDLPDELRLGDAMPEESSPSDPHAHLSMLAKSEFEQIRKAMQDAAGNATVAARQLGIARSTLYLKFKKYGLDDSVESWRSTP